MAQQAFVDHYYSNCCKHLDITAEKSQHISKNHLNSVFEHFIRPAFSQHIHPAIEKRPQAKYRDPHLDTDILNNQIWKNNDHGFSAVDILEWATTVSSKEELKTALPKVIPPTLLMLDDYDISFKERGTILLHNLVGKLDSTTLSRHGLENVFVDVLFKCLTYVSEDRDLPLLESSYPCLVDLVGKTKKPCTKERMILYERILTDGVILGLTYSGHKTKFLRVLLKPIKRLYEELGALGVRHLEVVIPALCSALKLAPSSPIKYNLYKDAIEGLDTVIVQCWPRIPHYRGIILAGLATAWTQFYTVDGKSYSDLSNHNSDAEAICQLLRRTFKHLYNACEDSIKADIDVLLDYNEELFGILVKSDL